MYNTNMHVTQQVELKKKNIHNSCSQLIVGCA